MGSEMCIRDSSVAVGVMKSVIALILFTFANTASKKIRGTSVF